ncbi:MAG: hypothetical protein R3C05_26970 [Pirellulaceae bacterium]
MSHVETIRTDVLPGDTRTTSVVSAHQYAERVKHGHFDSVTGRIELISGKIIRMNPQGPRHVDPIDLLAQQCVEPFNGLFARSPLAKRTKPFRPSFFRVYPFALPH